MQSNRKHYRAGLYMRLSRDDGVGESSSITTQRKILRAYAEEHDFSIYDEYIDDGWSGTSFERPEFKRMISDIEAGKVNLVLTKDLSRLGRDYITAGQYTEIYFPSKGVRYIAINDGYDSDSPYTDIAPFKNVINEMYARDTSRKIRSAFSAKMQGGSYIGNFAPYGYQKDPGDKNHLVPDPVTAPIVQRLFRLAEAGTGLSEIARILNGEGVVTPAVYRCMTHPYLKVEVYTKRREWTPAGVSKLLRNRTYLGHTVQGKTTKVSFKSDLTLQNPKEDWIVVENTHEALVGEETFSVVQRIMQSRTCRKTKGFRNIFSGLAKCAECGRNMSATGTRKKGAAANLVCGGYKLYGSSECSNHAIDYETLYHIVLEAVRAEVALSGEERRRLAEELSRSKQDQETENDRDKEIAALQRRERELDGIIEKLYDDHLSGLISDSRLRKLLEKYEGETELVQKRLTTLEKSVQPAAAPRQTYEQFYKLVKEYTDVEALDPELLFKLIEKIEIGQGFYQKTETGRVKVQTVKIWFRFMTKEREYQYTA